ncbi:hypothetical protein [Azohydromonas aeria]|uniref:hypothetical protein n=1 Tax=Azohydromonas aeria TaxID=2590212 RepID=UPI0012FA9EDD|nr:hypothetical protein [Azohydromonas aeria]
MKHLVLNPRAVAVLTVASLASPLCLAQDAGTATALRMAVAAQRQACPPWIAKVRIDQAWLVPAAEHNRIRLQRGGAVDGIEGRRYVAIRVKLPGERATEDSLGPLADDVHAREAQRLVGERLCLQRLPPVPGRRADLVAAR